MQILPGFVDMAKAPAELAEESKPYDEQQHALPIYPYGLCLCFGNEELDKVGLTSDCEPGDTVHFQAIAKVTSVSKNETTEGPKSRVELQITHIAVDDIHDEEVAPSRPKMDYKKLYKEEE